MGVELLRLYFGVEITATEYAVAMGESVDGVTQSELIDDCVSRLINPSPADDAEISQHDDDDDDDGVVECGNACIGTTLTAACNGPDYDAVDRFVIGLVLGSIRPSRTEHPHLPAISFDQLLNVRVKFNAEVAKLATSQPTLHALIKRHTPGIVLIYG